MSWWAWFREWVKAFWASEAGQVVQDAFVQFVSIVGKAVADAILSAAVGKAVELQTRMGPGTGGQKANELNTFIANAALNLGVNLTGMLIEYVRGQAVMSPQVQALKRKQATGNDARPTAIPEPVPA